MMTIDTRFCPTPVLSYKIWFLRCAQTVGVHRRVQKLGDAGSPPLWDGAWLAIRNTLIPHIAIVPNFVALGQIVRA